jgi:hypothetical protein
MEHFEGLEEYAQYLLDTDIGGFRRSKFINNSIS